MTLALVRSATEKRVVPLLSALVARHRSGVQLFVGRPSAGAQMMRPHALVGWVGCCVAVGVMLLAASSRAAPAKTVEEVGADVVVLLRDAGMVAQQRAASIAAVPSLAYAVATDQQTMLDMTADELSFHAQPGEIVEVGQVALKSGKVTPLRREGDGALVHLPLGAAGLHFVVAGDTLYAVEVVDVQPRGREHVLRGAVGVARAIDLAAASARLAKLGAGAQLRVGDGALTLGHAPSQATATIVHPPLGAQLDPELTLLMPPPRHSIGAVMALAFVGLGIAFGVVIARRRRVLHESENAYHGRPRVAAR
jgi:hypothetical protein